MKKRVLVVDDENDILELISIILSDNDITVYKAKDGLSGLEIARKKKPDLILLDIMMPEIDGWEVLKILKIDDETRNIPVAMLTCKTEIKDKVLGIQEGAIDYITKPFLTDDIIKKVKNLLTKEGKEDSSDAIE